MSSTVIWILHYVCNIIINLSLAGLGKAISKPHGRCKDWKEDFGVRSTEVLCESDSHSQLKFVCKLAMRIQGESTSTWKGPTIKSNVLVRFKKMMNPFANEK